ncbi:LIM and calponin homology domains-containing protein 1-like isoform X6 [Poecilia reticulata]|uniref:LIM and calponin homology domains-containing protein 1-like isoform X6 n=1 Tax=Poecilia reticulata TaxID=8081 RepID=UPI0004A311CD|nr:PREDICTED: LIM and calponin homology domains-containing protein 1-like isoform X6 [Poecilia reticulata]
MAGPEPSHPEPVCLEAQKWIEAVTGKNFGDKDFRSALENGILLCELLSAIKPGLVKKINRLPTPIAGLDNLSVFLRGCEELGLKGSQLFDPGDLQDTSIRANLKDSDCNRKLKNVLNTVFWLGKAASGCPSYSGPNLNLKEFEGLLSQMKLESDDGGDSSQKRSVRDSGYDCWDSERSESLSPPQHTRDNSLDSLDSFGSRSQHSPSPDVVNRGNSDGRGSDSEADAPSRKPDVRKDDMLARRTASSDSRCPVPFNQFLPNRANASCYIPTPRRKQHPEEGEQRSHLQTIPEQTRRIGFQQKPPKTVTWAPESQTEKLKQGEDLDVLEQRRLEKLKKAGIKVLPAAVRYNSTAITEEKEARSPSPNIILRSENEFLSSHSPACDSSSDGEKDAKTRRVPDVHRDDLASRRVHRSPGNSRVHQFVPPPACTTRDRERWEGIRRASQQTLQQTEISEKEAVCDIITRKDSPSLKEEEDEGEEGKDKTMPNKQRDDLARRRGQSRPLPQRDGPISFVSSSMSPSDVQKWESLRMTEPSEDRPAPVCQACLQRTYGISGSAKAGRGHDRVVTFGGLTEIEQPTEAVTAGGGEEPESLRRLRSKATVAMTTVDLSSWLSDGNRSSFVAMAAELEAPAFKAPSSPACPGLAGRQVPDAAVIDAIEPSSSSSSSSLIHPYSPPSSHTCSVEEQVEAGREEEKSEDGKMRREKKPCWLEDELPPMMVSRRVAFLLDNESVSMGDMANEDEAGHFPSLSPSRYERMHQQYNAFVEEEDQWQDDLARWKNRRRSASQELIKKEEERKRMEKRMKGNGVDGNKRKSIKTYKEIVEEKERREAELCEAYRQAATPEEAALVLQRYALRFTISDATLDSLKLPRSTNKPKQFLNQTEQEHSQTSGDGDSERLEHPNQPDTDSLTEQERCGQTEDSHEKHQSGVNLSSSLEPDALQLKDTNTYSEQLQSEQLPEPPSHLTDPHDEHKNQPDPGAPQSPTDPAAALQPKHKLPSLPSAPSRPLPQLAAKPFCPPRCSAPEHKLVEVQQLDGSVRLNGEAAEDFASLPDPLQENPAVSSQHTQEPDPPEDSTEQPEPPLTERPAPTSGSAISSLIAGRNCIITTTIVTELTKTYMEPLHPDVQDNAEDGATETPAEKGNPQPVQSPSSLPEYSPSVSEGLEESNVTIETPMLNLAKRVNHWVWDPNEERKRLESWQQEQERLLQEQYQKEQEKLKKEWEKAQLEVEEEERKHNEEERRILEETVAPLSPSASVQRQAERTATAPFSVEENNNGTVRGNVSLQQNGQKIHTGSEDQHVSKLHFFQDSGCDEQLPQKQEMWKTSSLDRSPQTNQMQNVKRSGSHDAVAGNQEVSPSAPQPPSPSRCVSGKRLCSGCSKPLGRGAAMIIDTLGLFFHMQCFKCGVCKGQLGDATAGTDVRIRNGLLSCYECYIASRGRGQPTPL